MPYLCFSFLLALALPLLALALKPFRAGEPIEKQLPHALPREEAKCIVQTLSIEQQ